MKRLIFSVFVTLFVTVAAQASRAYSEPMTVTQPDGSSLTVVLSGDEHFHWMQTMDGVLVVNTGKGYMVAHIDEQGRLTATAQLAHEAVRRTGSEQALVSQQVVRQPLFYADGEERAAAMRRASITSSAAFPHEGSPKVLVVLAQFQDVKFTLADPVKSYDQYYNSTATGALENYGNREDKNYCSVRAYFEACSHGAFTPDFTVVGPLTLPGTLATYGSNSSGQDSNVGQLYTDVISQLDAQDFDFQPFVTSGDKTIGTVIVIYAGYGENVGAAADGIWAKNSPTVRNTKGGFSVQRFCISAELNGASIESFSTGIPWINGIGVAVHEFSHSLGLPDMYPNTTASRSVNNQTMEYWDLMDYGEYLNNGCTPTPYTAWEQETMGWLQIEEMKAPAADISLIPLLEGGKAYKFNNGASNEEWFIVENVQQRGFNARAYGHGMLVYHVNYASHTVTSNDYPNNEAGKPRMTIVPADGLLISGFQTLKSNGASQGYGGTYTQDVYKASLAGDPFPGSQGVTMLTAKQELPGFAYYNGEATPAYSLANIREDEETGFITFDFTDQDPTGIRVIENGEMRMENCYNLQGQRVAQPTRGIYIKNGRKVVVNK